MKGKISLFLVSMLLVLAACSNATNEELAPDATPASISTQTTDEVKEAIVEEVVEGVSEPVSYLQNALEQAKKTETVWFSSGVGDSFYFYSNETNMLESAHDYFYNVNAQLRRSPASLKADELYTNSLQEFDASGNSTFFDESTTEYTTYVVAGDGLYSETLGTEQMFKYAISDNFKTAEHLEGVVDLFLRYPEQLEIIDAFDAGNNPDAAIIQYKLTNAEFVALSNEFRQSFFTGNYAGSDVEIDIPNADTMEGLYLEIAVDREFNVLNYAVTYTDKLVSDETSNSNDYYYYRLDVYFYSPNDDFTGEIPDEVRQTAVEPEDEEFGD